MAGPKRRLTSDDGCEENDDDHHNEEEEARKLQPAASCAGVEQIFQPSSHVEIFDRTSWLLHEPSDLVRMMISWGRGFLFRENWRVPRSVVCGMFWMAVFLLFVGMILLVISKHKGGTYVVWGGILLGLGFCIVLVCFLLCLNAYIILARKNKLPQPVPQTKTFSMSPSSSTIIHGTSPSQPLDYPHIFVPIQPPSLKFQSPEQTPALKRSAEFEKSVSFDIDSSEQTTPGRKKKVRLQNGDTNLHDKRGCSHDDVIGPSRTTRSNPNFSLSPRELNSSKPPPFSSHEVSKLKNETSKVETNAGQQKFLKNHRVAIDGRAEHLTDDEIHRKSHNPPHQSHSRTLSQPFRRTEDEHVLMENIGSMRVKVRPIKSRLYAPDWVPECGQQTRGGDTMNVIHF